MPIIKSAKKALRQTKRRTVFNRRSLNVVRKAIKNFRKKPTPEDLKKVTSEIDKAVKKGFFHQNKANRLKKQFNKLVSEKTPQKKKATNPPQKSASKKVTRAKMKK